MPLAKPVLHEYARIRKDQARHLLPCIVYGRMVRPQMHEGAKAALRLARTTCAFDALVFSDLARFETAPDDWYTFDDHEGDTYSPAANPDIKPAILDRERKAELDRANREGFYVLSVQVRESDDAQWETLDSCGGFLGDDWRGSGYDLDMMRVAVDWHADRLQEKRDAWRAALHEARERKAWAERDVVTA